MAALVLRIKFPMTYPLIYKTLRVDANFTTKEAVKFIAETVNVANLLNGNEGLYLPDEKRWLDDSTPLSTYDSLQDVVWLNWHSDALWARFRHRLLNLVARSRAVPFPFLNLLIYFIILFLLFFREGLLPVARDSFY